MKKLTVLFIGLFLSFFIYADDIEAPSCAGDYLEGRVISGLTYQSGKTQKGIELSHTKFNIKATDGKTYEVSVDNVFTNDYSATTIPYSLKERLQDNTKVQLCGEKYTDGTGIHWVHTECPAENNVEGYVVVNGVNLTSSKQYCYIF
ncbi:hypothetical protein LO80_06235 [Candidatus Francisella endociliophora]|uniref:Uncharacterized protein n=1 Tax=Candidatus Francisella endociliophora TaxID=653937 RepID=A0A097EPV4_9GAMM|nr:hypothetical protein [Francisella sp. FSC1006]AIT09598.1 hypothetical protein LO80_06235 [Francisella sp. FSC1006]